jgi:phospholipase/carboxylesterase
MIIQQPTGTAEQLILLFHGVGANAQNMAPLGQRLANEFPNAFVVSVDSPQASDLGPGRQWFSVRGVTEENRTARVEAAMPGFQATVRHWQGVAKVGVEGTTLVGFSQGAIMALESTQQSQILAGRVIAIAGRFAQPPRSAPPETTLHLIHGEQDPVIPPASSIDAARRLEGLGAEVTTDLIPMLGHAIDSRVLERIIERMRKRARSTH